MDFTIGCSMAVFLIGRKFLIRGEMAKSGGRKVKINNCVGASVRSATELRALREKKHLSRRQVGEVIGRSHEWVRLVEVGDRALTDEIRNVIFRAIEYLSRFEAVDQKRRQRLVTILGLPRHIRANR
jgi:hypothetical protein